MRVGHTAFFTEVKAQEDADDTADDEEESDEVEICDMLLETPSLVRVQVQEKEEKSEGNSTSRPGKICERYTRTHMYWY